MGIEISTDALLKSFTAAYQVLRSTGVDPKSPEGIKALAQIALSLGQKEGLSALPGTQTNSEMFADLEYPKDT